MRQEHTGRPLGRRARCRAHPRDGRHAPIGERLRAILHDIAVTDLDDRAEALIAAADRAQHIAQVVRPALAAGRPVVSDRSVYSTLAYQGYGRGLDVDELRRINDWAIGGCWPDACRAARRTDRRPRRRACTGATSTASSGPATDFHARVVAGFRDDGRRRPRPLGRRRRGRRPRRGCRVAVLAALGGASVTSVWDARRRPAGRRATPPRRRRCAGARLPVRRAAGLDEGRGRPGVRRRRC